MLSGTVKSLTIICALHPDDLSVDAKVDGALPLEVILSENVPLRQMILSMNLGKKWLFTNAGKTVDVVEAGYDPLFPRHGLLPVHSVFFIRYY